MSLRHTPRQSDRDVRLHDPHAPHAHAHSVPPPAHHHHGNPPHINGNGIPATPVGIPVSSHVPPAPQLLLASPVMSAVAPNGVVVPASIQKLAHANEQTWLLIGRVAEQMGNLEHALSAYENALRHNPMSLPGLTQVAGIARIKENYPKAVEYFQRVIDMQRDNGEVWSALGHCYLMQDDLQKAYNAYQQALYLLPNPKEDPKLWYGIGILYDRYGSLDHAEEAFASVLRMDKDFDKANEILFRLGIIYKQQGKYTESLDCFDRILRNPPNPLAHADIWFQIGHVFEQQRDHLRARDAYERVVVDNPGHAKVLQQLGWLYHQDGSSFQNQDLAIQYLTKSLEAEPADAQSWYLLGRAYMAGQKYNKAYEAYQQAVYRDGRNPTFWCSIGVLYFQINQYRDALDAYSRAIRINPYISEVWFDLGSLYESCNNQISDAIDAYARAAELDPSNTAIAQRLQLLKTAQATGGTLPAAPGPQDVHPTAYANPMMPPGAFPMLLQPGGSRPIFRTDSRGPPSDLPLPMPPQLNSSRSSPGPFRGGPPPPVVLDDNRVPSHTPLAPMDVDRISHHSREHSASYPPSSRDSGPRGPAGQSLLLHHPVLSQSPVDGMRQPHHEHARPLRMPSTSASPPPHAHLRARSPQHLPPFERVVGPGQTPGPVSRRTPPLPYSRDERESAWDRRIVPIPIDHAEWERERRGRPPSEYPVHTSPAYYASRPHSPRGPSPRGPRERSPDVSPRAVHPTYRPFWEKPPTSGPGVPRSPLRPPMDMQEPMRRYDPRFDAREAPNQYERERGRERERDRERESMDVLDPRDPRYVPSPDVRARGLPPPGHYASESPRIPLQTVSVGPAEPKERRRRTGKERDAESSAGSTSAPAAEAPPKKERKRRVNTKRVKEEPQRRDNPAGPLSFKYRKTVGSPEPASSGSGRSVQPSPTGSAHLPPARVVDEDYDEGVADALMGLSQYPRAFGPGRAPGASPRTSISSRSPPVGTKRPLSPAPTDEHADKRSRVGSISGRPTSHSISSNSNGNSGGRPTPTPSMRPSPIPFHQQPSSHSPETRQTLDRPSYPPSPSLPPSLPMMLPPHPRPIGAGLSHAPPMTLPPLAHPPAPAVVSPQRDRDADGDERMHSRSASPPRGAKRDIVPHGTSVPASASGSPSAKATPLPASSNGRAGPIP